MDTHLNNDASLTHDEGATFGEYRTTTKVNGVQSEYTPNVDAIPGADAEYGGHTSVENELVGADTKFDTNFDVVQASAAGANDTAETNPFEVASSTAERGITLGNITDDADDGGAQFGEYRTTTKVNGVESLYTPNVDAIPSAEDLIDKNDFTSSTPIVDANISESRPLVDAASGLNLGDTTTSKNYNVTTSELADTNGNKANDEDLENFNVFNSNDNQANEAINDIKQNIQVYDGVLHHSIEPVVDNVNENQTEQLNERNDNYSHIIDTATLNDNYQSAEPTPIIDTDAANENYQTNEPTPIIDTDAAADNNQNIEPNTLVDTSDAPEDSVSYDSANPEINDNPNVDTQIDATEDDKQETNEAQTSSPIIEDYNPNFTTNPEQIIDSKNEQEATQNFETTVTENENVFESKTPMVTPHVENINAASGLATSDTNNLQTNNNLITTDYSTTNTGKDLTNVQTTDNFDYNKFLGNYQVTQNTGSGLTPSQNITQTKPELTQKPLKTNPFKYKASSHTAPVINYKSALTLNEEPKVQPTTTITTKYTQAAPLAAIPETNLKTSTSTNIPAQYTQTAPVTANESVIKPTTIPKDKPTTITGMYTPATYAVYSQKNDKTTFEQVIKPPEIPKMNQTSTITTTNTPAGYEKLFETTPATVKPTTATTTFTTTPTQYTTYSETGTMKPTTTTTTFTSTPAGYEKLFETTPATVKPTTTTTTLTTTPAQYTTFSETTPAPVTIKPTTTTTTFTTTPAQYTTYSETTPITVKPTTTTFTTTPAQYTTYSETTPVTMEPTTTTTTFTSTPAQYTTYSETTPVTTFESIIKPTTYTTAPAQYTTYSETTPITTQSTTFTSPAQYTTYSETNHMPITTTSSVSIPRVEQYSPIETLYTPRTTITRNIVPQNISVVPQPILPPKPQPITVTVPKIQKVIVPKIKKVYVPSQKKIYVRTPSAGSIMNYSTGSQRAITTAIPTPAPIVTMAASPQVIPTSQTLPFNRVPIVSTIPNVKSSVAAIPQRSYIVPNAPTVSQLPLTNSIVNPAGLPANGMLIQSQLGLVNLPYSQRSYSATRSGLVNVPYSQRSYRVPQSGLVNVPYSQGSFAMTQSRLGNLPYSQGSARLLNVPYGQGSVMVPQQVPYSQASIPVAQANYGQSSIPISNYSQSSYSGMRRPTLYSTSSHRSNSPGYGNYRTQTNVVNPYSGSLPKYSTRTYKPRRL